MKREEDHFEEEQECKKEIFELHRKKKVALQREWQKMKDKILQKIGSQMDEKQYLKVVEVSSYLFYVMVIVLYVCEYVYLFICTFVYTFFGRVLRDFINHFLVGRSVGRSVGQKIVFKGF